MNGDATRTRTRTRTVRPAPRRPAAWLPAVLLSLVAGPWLTAPTSVAATDDDRAGGLAGEVRTALQRCARPALLPAVRVPRTGAKAVRTVAATGHRLGLPARAQGLAVTAVLADELGAAGAERFYRRLTRVDRWQSLPPTIALHRVLGTPDPFAYEQTWPRATALLAGLADRPEPEVARAVAPGGGAPRDCTATALSGRALPLPPGSGYRAAGSTAASDELLLAAPCGTPVTAATAGEVAVVRDDVAGGPWVLTVAGNGGVTRYAHVQQPVVAAGSVVRAGDPLAQVGDLGAVDRCALGLRSTTSAGATRSTATLARWLVSRTAGVTGLQALAEAVDAPDLPAAPSAPHRRSRIAAGSPGATVPVEPDPRPTAPTSFRTGTFNVLGSHLTAPGGGRPGFGPGGQRMTRGLARIEASGASVVVLNEFETPAASALLSDGDWQLHRATPNTRFRDGNTNGNAVAWRSDTWTAVAADEFTVPWRVTLHMPVVTLEHRTTGARVTVVGVHNPANTAKVGNQSSARAVARRVELAQVAALRRADPTTPVLVAGDFNERVEVYCDFLGSGLQSSAMRPAGSRCRAPGHSVDWIFATSGLSFGGEVVDRSTLGSISDHPLVTAAVTLPPQTR